MPISAAIERRGSRDTTGGFTLIEMVVALTIIGLIAALGLPMMRPNRGTAALKAKRFEIAAMLRTERNAALKTGRTTTVTIDREGQTIRSARSDTRIDIPAPMALRRWPVGLARFDFYPDGRASGGDLSLTSGDMTFSLRVNTLTAAIDISDRRSGNDADGQP